MTSYTKYIYLCIILGYAKFNMRALETRYRTSYRDSTQDRWEADIAKYSLLSLGEEVELFHTFKRINSFLENRDDEDKWSQTNDDLEKLVREKKGLLHEIYEILHENYGLKYENIVSEENNIEQINENLDKLLKIWKKKILDRICEWNLRFVESVANQYKRLWVDTMDLIQEWCLGLIKAAPRFDETRWFKFISYGVRWIRQAILKFLSESSIIQIPANIKNLMRELWKWIEECGFMPDKKEIQKRFNLTDKQYESLMSWFTWKTLYLDDSLDSDDDKKSLWDTIAIDTESPDDNIIRKTEKSKIIWALEHLLEDKATHRQALACALFYWLNPKWVNPEGKEHSYEEISKIFKDQGADRDVSSIGTTLSRARKKLKRILTPDWQISEGYKREFEQKHHIDSQIYDIFRNTSKEKITRAFLQLQNKNQTENQAKVFSLYFWISSIFNPDWKKYTIEEIAKESEKREGSTKTTLEHAAKNFIEILRKSNEKALGNVLEGQQKNTENS